jgi:hypothetical protein
MIMDDSQRDKYIAATKELVETLGGLVESVKERFSQLLVPGSSQFSMIGITKGMMSIADPLWTAYWKWLNALGAKTRQEMEEIQKSFGDDKDILKCTEELHATEAGFREIAAQLDGIVQKEEDKVI